MAGAVLWDSPLLGSYTWPMPTYSLQRHRSPFHPFLPFLKELFTGAVSTQKTTWFLHSGRDPNSQTLFQLEGNTTHELGTPSVSLATTVCLLVKRKAQISL